MFTCYKCGKEGHISRNCPDVTNTNTSTSVVTTAQPDEKSQKASARLSKVGDSSQEITAYMVRAMRKRKADGTEPNVKIPIEKTKKTKTKNKKRSSSQKSVDPDVLKFYKKMNVPLELVARHGAAFEMQSKRVI